MENVYEASLHRMGLIGNTEHDTMQSYSTEVRGLIWNNST